MSNFPISKSNPSPQTPTQKMPTSIPPFRVVHTPPSTGFNPPFRVVHTLPSTGFNPSQTPLAARIISPQNNQAASSRAVQQTAHQSLYRLSKDLDASPAKRPVDASPPKTPAVPTNQWTREKSVNLVDLFFKLFDWSPLGFAKDSLSRTQIINLLGKIRFYNPASLICFDIVNFFVHGDDEKLRERCSDLVDLLAKHVKIDGTACFNVLSIGVEIPKQTSLGTVVSAFIGINGGMHFLTFFLLKRFIESELQTQHLHNLIHALESVRYETRLADTAVGVSIEMGTANIKLARMVIDFFKNYVKLSSHISPKFYLEKAVVADPLKLIVQCVLGEQKPALAIQPSKLPPPAIIATRPSPPLTEKEIEELLQISPPPSRDLALAIQPSKLPPPAIIATRPSPPLTEKEIEELLQISPLPRREEKVLERLRVKHPKMLNELFGECQKTFNHFLENNSLFRRFIHEIFDAPQNKTTFSRFVNEILVKLIDFRYQPAESMMAIASPLIHEYLLFCPNAALVASYILLKKFINGSDIYSASPREVKPFVGDFNRFSKEIRGEFVLSNPRLGHDLLYFHAINKLRELSLQQNRNWNGIGAQERLDWCFQTLIKNNSPLLPLFEILLQSIKVQITEPEDDTSLPPETSPSNTAEAPLPVAASETVKNAPTAFDIPIFFSSLDNQAKKVFLKLAKEFAGEINLYLNHTGFGPTARLEIQAEGGIFCFALRSDKGLAAYFFKIYGKLKAKYPQEMELYGRYIAEDAFRFWNAYSSERSQVDSTVACYEKRNDFRQNHSLLSREQAGRIAHVLIQVKYREYLHHFQDLTSSSFAPYINQSIPCFLISHDREATLTLFMAHFDERGFLFALTEDRDGVAQRYAKEKFGIERASSHFGYYVSREQLSAFREDLSQNHEKVPFFLLEERLFSPTPTAPQNIKPSRLPKGAGKTKKRKKVSKEEVCVPEEELQPLPAKRQRTAHAPLPKVIGEVEKENNPSLSFWADLSLRQCDQVQRKMQTPAKIEGTEELEFNIPEGVFSEAPTPQQTLYVLPAKEYQQASVDRLSYLSSLGVSGFLALDVGMGKTLCLAELLMRYLASGNRNAVAVFTLNAVRPQLMRELKTRSAKAIFSTAYAALVHWESVPQAEKGERLSLIKNFILNRLPLLKQGARFKACFSLDQSNQEAFKEVLILVEKLPPKEKEAFLQTLGLENKNMRSQLQRLAIRHDAQFPHQAKVFLESQKNEKVLLATIVACLKNDPSFPYEKVNVENYPGKDLEKFRALLSYPLDDEHFICGPNLPTKNDGFGPVYCLSYHELSLEKNKFKLLASHVKFGMLFADEFHTLSNSDAEGGGSQKNEQMSEFIRMVRANNTCAMYPCSGTPVRGELSEYLMLFEHFNPDFIPRKTQARITQTFKESVSHLKYLASSEEDAVPDESVKSFFETYVALRHLNRLFQALSVRARPKDPRVIEQWNGQIPSKQVVPLSLEASALNLHREVVHHLAKLNHFFTLTQSSAESDIKKLKGRYDKLLAHADLLKEVPVETIVEQIRKGNVAEEIKKSYLASLLITEEFKKDVAEKRRVVVNFFYQDTFEILKAFVETLFGDQVEVYAYHGDTKKEQREAIVARFNQNDARAVVLFLSLPVGSTGLNLPGGHKAYSLEKSFTYDPFQDKQAQARIIRVNNPPDVKVVKVVKLASFYLIEQYREIIYSKKRVFAKSIMKRFDDEKKQMLLTLRLLKKFAQHNVFNKTRDLEALKKLDNAADRLMQKIEATLTTQETQTLLKRPLKRKIVETQKVYPTADKRPRQASPLSPKKREREEKKTGEPELKKSKGKERIKESASVVPSQNFIMEIDESQVLSIPLRQGSKIEAIRCAQFLLDNLQNNELCTHLTLLDSTLRHQGHLKNFVRHQGGENIGGQIGQFYRVIDSVSQKPKYSSHHVQIYEFRQETNSYHLVDVESASEQSSEAPLPVRLRKVYSMDKEWYDVLIFKSQIRRD